MKAMKTHTFTGVLLLALLVLLAACGGGGGGIGGGLIPGLMTMNTAAVMSGGSTQLTINGGLPPYSFSIYRGIGGVTVAPFGASVDSSGLVTVDDIGDTLDYLIIKVVDDLNRKKYFRVAIMGQPATWLKADSISAVNLYNGFVSLMPDQSGNGNDASLDTGDCSNDRCPLLIGTDSLLNNNATLYFDGVDDYLKFSSGFTNDYTLAMVFRAGAGSGGPPDTWGNGAAMVRNSQFGVSLPESGVVSAGTSTNLNSAAGQANNAGHMVILSRDDAGNQVYASVDAGGIGLGADANIAVGLDTYLGADTSYTANFFDGYIPEVIVYDRLISTAPTDPERVVLSRYLKEKYNIPLPLVDPPVVTIDTATVSTGSYEAEFAYTYTVSPYLDVESVECKLVLSPGTADFTDCRNPDEFITNYTKYYGSLVDGDYTFTVKVTDSDGTEATDTHSWTIDSQDPVCTITDPVNGGWSVLNDDATVTFSCTDLSFPLTYECQVDGGGWNPCTSPFDAKPNSAPTNTVTTVEVRATDNVGNGPSDPVSTTFTTDTDKPTCTAITGTTGVAGGDIEQDTSEGFSFSCTDGTGSLAGNRVQCHLEKNIASVWTTVSNGNCTSDTTHTAVISSGGEYRLTIQVTDQAGLVSDPDNAPIQRITWMADLADPSCAFTSAPSGFGGDNPSVAEFTCSDDSDTALEANDGLHEIQCRYHNGTVWSGWNDCTSRIAGASDTEADGTYSVTSNVEGTTYQIEVQATDHAGRASTVISTSWIADMTDPTCWVTSQPSLNPPSEDSTPTVEFECLDTPIGVMSMATATCNLNGGGAVPCSVIPTGTGTVTGSNTMSPGGGEHTLEIIGYDLAGRAAAPISATWRTDLTIPVCVITPFGNGGYANSNPTQAIGFQCDDDVELLNPVQQDAKCTLEDITGAPVIMENAVVCDGAAAFANASPGQTTGTYTTPALTEGNTYRLTVNIEDNSTPPKTMSAPPTVTWIVDTTVPTATITSVPSGFDTDNTPTITFDTADDASGVNTRTCDIAGPTSINVPCGAAGSHTFTTLADGSYTFTLSYTDNAGNSGVDQVSAAWTIDTTVPVITQGVEERMGVDSRRLNFSITETNLVSTECRYSVDNGSTWSALAPCTTPYLVSGLAGGDRLHYEVNVTDSVGYTDQLVVIKDIMRGARIPSECSALTGGGITATPNYVFGNNAGDNNTCILVEDDGGVAGGLDDDNDGVDDPCATATGAAWTEAVPSPYTTTIVTSNSDLQGIYLSGYETGFETVGVGTSNNVATYHCNDDDGDDDPTNDYSITCSTGSHSWGTAARETCTYDRDRVAATGWHWVSYGNTGGLQTLMNSDMGNALTTSCPKNLIEGGGCVAFVPGGHAEDPVIGNHSACMAEGTNTACCRQSCQPNCVHGGAAGVTVVRAVITEAACQ